jgi:23S rRNA (adenine2503-C2)-methyltransferase
MENPPKRNILSLTPEELEAYFQTVYQEPAYRAMQVFQWLYKPIGGFSDMANIPKALRERLEHDFYFGVPEVVRHLASSDGTHKLLLKLPDDHIVEAVLIPYHYGDSVCISTQVGCKLGCAFCASGRNGFIRHLEAGEIIGEILALQKISGRRISSLSLMGTGEPLDNYDNIVKFLELVHHPKGENLGYRSISLSTAGVVPKIYELAEKKLPITLCVSLHFPTDEQRSEMMPINRKYPLADLIKAVKFYTKKSDHRMSFEYTLIKGVNDSHQHAQALIKLVKHVFCHINLIPVNKTDDAMLAPDKKDVYLFQKWLTDGGLNVTVRRKAGDDIAAACGQLKRYHMGDDTPNVLPPTEMK